MGTLCDRLAARAEPVVDRSDAVRPIEEIHDASLCELERLEATRWAASG